MRPRFSILIQTHDQPEPLARTLASLRFSLTRDDAECIALANGGGPAVRRLLLAEPGIRRATLWPEARHLAAGRARLFRRARGAILVLLEPGALITDSLWLDRLAAALAAEPVGLAGPEGLIVSARWRGGIPAPPGPCDVVAGWCMALKREALLAAPDLTDDSGPAREDADVCRAVQRGGYEVLCTGPVGVAWSGPEARRTPLIPCADGVRARNAG